MAPFEEWTLSPLLPAGNPHSVLALLIPAAILPRACLDNVANGDQLHPVGGVTCFHRSIKMAGYVRSGLAYLRWSWETQPVLVISFAMGLIGKLVLEFSVALTVVDICLARRPLVCVL